MAKVITGAEMLNKHYPEITTLWGPFIETEALNALIGGSDTGKSTFLRQLSLAIVLRRTHFLGQPLYLNHARVLIVSIEDGETAVGRMLKGQLERLAPHIEALENLHFIFEYEGSLEQLLGDHLKENQYDLIIIDCYSDAYTGKSSNDHADVKSFLRDFDNLAKKFKTAMLFLHHLNKKGDEGDVGKGAVLGSSAFEQKMRCLLALSKQGYGDSIRLLKVVKGNYISSEIKKKALKLDFNEQLLEFHFIGHEELVPKTDYNKDRYQEVAQYAVDVLGVGTDRGKTYDEAMEEISTEFDVKISRSTLHKYVTKLLEERKSMPSDSVQRRSEDDEDKEPPLAFSTS